MVSGAIIIKLLLFGEFKVVGSNAMMSQYQDSNFDTSSSSGPF